MKVLFKEIYELYISNILISNNFFVNLCLLSIIGFSSYKIAYYVVGKLGFRNNVGSFFHWFIRSIVFGTLSSLFIFCVKVYNFVKELSLLNKYFLLAYAVLVILFIIKTKKRYLTRI